SPVFSGEEQESALLGDARHLVDRFGPPEISVAQMIDWVSHWVDTNGRSLGKPTKYESRSGKF
ncbi:MAG: epimerase, partial [Candidatus Latescibacteria bacterium]|nr:epimerase [Candidatus Latescibacterota bacterium]